MWLIVIITELQDQWKIWGQCTAVGICPHLILADTLTLLESEGTVYAHQINCLQTLSLFSLQKQCSRQETCCKNRISLFVPYSTLYGIAV